MTIEHKSFSCAIKAIDDDQGIIEAYGSVYDYEDASRDIVRQGAFKRSIQNSKSRMLAGKSSQLAVMLWQHNTDTPIGSWVELTEDNHGLKCKGRIILTTQAGKDAYELVKNGVVDQLSIGYDIPSGGSNYDSKTGIRNLTELRLWEVSLVTFACNDEALVTSIKSSDLEIKASDSATATGNTKGPIGPRDESWDGSEAESQIWAVAYDDKTSEVNKALAKKYFMLTSGDGTKKGDYSYPFWYVGSSPHICVGAVFAIAAAIQGSRGANAPEALKPKIEGLYKRISAKYADNPAPDVPWKDDTKGAAMSTRQRKAGNAPVTPHEKKTFAEHLAEESCQDLLEDWQDVILCSLTASIYDAMTIGDTPESDVKDALTAFGETVMQWVAMAVQYDLSGYIESQGYDYDGGTESAMQYGTESRPNYGGYGMMSRGLPMLQKMLGMSRKAMTASDATTGGFTADHVAKLKKSADAIMTKTNAHADALHAAADKVSGMLDAAQKSLAMKAGAQFSSANAASLGDHADGLHDMADKMVSGMTRQTKAINSVADDLATVLQGSEAAYGTDSGNAGDRTQGKSAPYPNKGARATETPPSLGDTVTEEDLSNALSIVQTLRKVSSIPAA